MVNCFLVKAISVIAVFFSFYVFSTILVKKMIIKIFKFTTAVLG